MNQMNKRLGTAVLSVAALFAQDYAFSQPQREAQQAADYIESFAKTCAAFNQTGEISFRFTTFGYLSETSEVLVGVIVNNDRTGKGFGTMTQTLLAELDPTPEFENFAKGSDSLPIIKFRCANGSCARNVAGAGVGAIGYVMLPACSGKERLANAFRALIEVSGGKKSRY